MWEHIMLPLKKPYYTGKAAAQGPSASHSKRHLIYFEMEFQLTIFEWERLNYNLFHLQKKFQLRSNRISSI